MNVKCNGFEAAAKNSIHFSHIIVQVMPQAWLFKTGAPFAESFNKHIKMIKSGKNIQFGKF